MNRLVQIGEIGKIFSQWISDKKYSTVVVLTDINTQQYCLPTYLSGAQIPQSSIQQISIPAGEIHKTMATCQEVWQALNSRNIDRNALLVNLGGGVVCDLGGFCAATWKRGVDFVQIPTTLLAMTDAAIGGKTGVDFENIKNLIGVFAEPAAVFVDGVWLKTLPEAEIRSGMAEIIKHALIGDAGLFYEIQSYTEPALSNSAAWIAKLLPASIAVKTAITALDPYENRQRKLLNYGHTVGHALESLMLPTKTPFSHGEAIAIGMIAESWIAEKMGFPGRFRLPEIVRAIGRFFPKKELPEAKFEEIMQAMRKDKKNKDGIVQIAVPAGSAFELNILEPEEALIKDALEYYRLLSFKNPDQV